MVIKMDEIEKPTFEICDGCEKYPKCLGGIHEDCELGYEDYLQDTEDALMVVDKSSDIKVFYVVDRSDDLKMLQETSSMLETDHGQENMIIMRHGKYELFTYPVIGHGANARFRRGNNE
jgi:hypothetical protein